MNSPLQIAQFSTADPDFAARFLALKASNEEDDKAIDQTVAAILEDIKKRGDVALLEYTNRFDGLNASSVAALEISQEECQEALLSLPKEIREALQTAAQRIYAYHEHQKQSDWRFNDTDEKLKGTWFGQKITPLERVGLYVPGGKASYPSSVLMNAIPAKVAGVAEIIMVVPTPKGERNALVLAAAAITGVDKIFTIGGAQAVAALAFGTKTIPVVDKITGPGNAYVAAAKRRVFGKVGIDMIAGPSEVLIIADKSAPADWLAMDLFAQAEHDEMAQSILLSPDKAVLEAVKESINRLLPTMERKEIIAKSLQKRGALIHVKNLEEACQIANQIAPEHLELAFLNAENYVDKIKHAGAIFIGIHASESLGDYCAGPNHVLPTSGSARFSSPLGVYDFQKRSSLICVSQNAATILGKTAAILANGEGLQAHQEAAKMRVKND